MLLPFYNNSSPASGVDSKGTFTRYEELAKRYKSLLEAYNEQSSAVGLRDKRLEQWQERVSATQAQLENAHHALIAVGEKFLSLKQKRNLQVTMKNIC